MNFDRYPPILNRICENNESIVWYFNKSSYGFDLCANPLTMLRKCDFVCLSNKKDIIKVWEWSKSIFGYSEEQVYFYEDYNNAEEERKIIIDMLSFFSNKNVIIFPNKTNLILNEEVCRFSIRVFNDNIYELPDKRWLHGQLINSKFSYNFYNVNLPEEVKVPRGFTCYSKDEIREAIKILESQNIKKYLIKEVFSCGGENIYFPESEDEFEGFMDEHINFENSNNCKLVKAYVVEEMIIINDKSCDTYVVHYLGDQLCPGIFKQHSTSFGYTGISSEQANSELESKILLQAESILNTLKFKGPWGMDFVVDQEGNPFLIDLNHGRICGSHYVRIFKDLFAPESKYFDAWNFALHYTYDLDTLQMELNKNDLQFDFSTQTGVILARVGEMWNGSVYFFSNNECEIKKYTEKFITILKQNGEPTEFNTL
jgi:hypothetical protein